jgi:pimeloyl-ACP methyl ester carboxylesterase
VKREDKMTAYTVLRKPRHETVRIRGLNVHLTRWGPEPALGEAPIFLLHGWQDTGDTFQFMVDEFARDWPLLALDWRGFGRSEWPQDGYWFPDYLADLDALLALFSPGAPARLVGHSMGGNIAALYAGVRPDRVRSIVNLEGFGMPRTSPQEAPGRLRKWLDELKSTPQLKEYESFERLADIIRARYPRLDAARAAFVAAAWGRAEANGRIRLLGDPRHRRVNPVLYKREDAEASWREIRAPILMMLGEDSELLPKLGNAGSEEAFRAVMPGVEFARVPGAGHMLHLERPELVAPLAEAFLCAH